MITLEFLEEQLHARPFVPFTLVLNSGDRYNIKTPDHADLPLNPMATPPRGSPGPYNRPYRSYRTHIHEPRPRRPYFGQQ